MKSYIWLAIMATISLFCPVTNSGSSWRYSGEEHQCSLYLYTDPFLWKQVFKMKDYNATATYNEIKGLLLRGVDRANEVFSGAEFYGRGTKIHKGISFKLAAYHIDTDQECQDGGLVKDVHRRSSELFYETECEELEEVEIAKLCQIKPSCPSRKNGTLDSRLQDRNVFCKHIRSMRFYLHAFSSNHVKKFHHEDFCLSFAFTHRNLDDFQGIAWIKGHDPNNTHSMQYYGYCAKEDPACLPGYFRNTGVVNAQVDSNNGHLKEEVIFDVFVHELGHSLGAKHDDHNLECNSNGRKDFLMTGDARRILSNKITHRLSVCSNREIGRNLDRSRCWKERQGYKKKTLKMRNATSDLNSAGGSELRKVDERRQTAQEIVNRIFYGAMALLAVTITISLAFNVYHWVSTHYGYLYNSSNVNGSLAYSRSGSASKDEWLIQHDTKSIRAYTSLTSPEKICQKSLQVAV